MTERKRRIGLFMDAYSQRGAAERAAHSNYVRAMLAPARVKSQNSPGALRNNAGEFRPNPDFKLIRNGYEIRVANGIEALKRSTARLIERMYSSRGLFPYGQGESLDDRNITIVACKGDHAIATLTLCIDADSGLLADTLYRDEIDAVRTTGGKVCEITRLAMDPEHSSHEALAGMMQILYVLARLTYRVTDVFIEVHPRHAGFYRRLLGYRMAGPERICPRVGAPAVLMHLCQHQLDQLIDRHAGRTDDDSRSFYRLFPKRSELEEMQRAIVAA